MTSTLRLPPALKAQATAYAETLGISLNALCAVALRDYLDARSHMAMATGSRLVAEPVEANKGLKQQVSATPTPSGVGLAEPRIGKGLSLADVTAAQMPVKRRSKRRK